MQILLRQWYRLLCTCMDDDVDCVVAAATAKVNPQLGDGATAANFIVVE